MQRLVISLALSGMAFLFIVPYHLAWLIELVVCWDVFSLAYLVTCWVVFFKRSTKEIKRIAQIEDGSRLFVFMIILDSSFASMFTALLLIVSKELSTNLGGFYLPVVFTGMLISWLVVHTTLGFHYAHIYYNQSQNINDLKQKDITFSGEKEPDYLDFAYLAFTVGMSFAVSDVAINSHLIRRLTLAHALLSFGLNTFVVALTINIIAGLQN